MNLTRISAIAGALLAIITLGGASWGAFELRQEVTYNTSRLDLQDFERLDAIRQRRQLTQVEWLRWCQAGIELKIFTVCPPRATK